MKKPKPGKLPLPHIQYTQDALDPSATTSTGGSVPARSSRPMRNSSAGATHSTRAIPTMA